MVHRSFDTKLWSGAGIPSCAGACTAVALSCVLLGGTCAHAEANWTFDVVPKAWITSNGELPDAASLKHRTGTAFVFPSLAPEKPSVPAKKAFTPACQVEGTNECRFDRLGLFRAGNKFASASFARSFVNRQPFDGGRHVLSIVIVVQRGDYDTDSDHDDARFIITSESLAHIQRLTWSQFRDLQDEFAGWLLRKGGCVFFGDRYKKFHSFNTNVLAFWLDVLAIADFTGFAQRSLNPPAAYKLETNNLAMWATPLSLREELAITWGGVAFYPDLLGSNASVSRPAVGGQTSLQVRKVGDGLALTPVGTPPSRSISLQPAGAVSVNAKVPFPQTQAGLLGTVFLPVYTPFDLQNERLLRSSGEQKTPSHLFVLSPVEYVSTDPQTATQVTVSQLTTDGRKFNSGTLDPQHFARRYIVIGTASDDEAALVTELKRLLDSATSGNAISSANDIVMAVFPNLTSLEVRRHVAIDGRVLDATRPRLETWAGVVGATMLPLYLEAANRSQPLLEIRRIVSSKDGTPETQLRFRFYLLDDGVLASAVIGEGDQFDHVSKSPHK